MSTVGKGRVVFAITASDSQRCLEARVSGADENDSAILEGFAETNGDVNDRFRKLRSSALYLHLPDGKTGSAEIQIGWALPHGFRMPSDWELKQWQELLLTDSLEDAIGLAQRRNKQLHTELGRVRSDGSPSRRLGWRKPCYALACREQGD